MALTEIRDEQQRESSSKVRSQDELDLIATAAQVLPGASFGNLPFQMIIREGHGSRVWDESGNEYVDYLLGSGPMLVGHAHPEVVAAVQAQVTKGTTFFANNRHGILLAAAIVDAVACAEQVRFVSTGTEADFYAMRLARAFRGRDKILKFEGGYHGMSDYGLMSLAPKREGKFPEPIPDSPGIPRSVRTEVLVAPFNATQTAVDMIREFNEELGGVIVEPFQRLIAPVPGFLEALRKATLRYGIPLIFDEIVTGFRFSYGGAQEYYGVTPDLCTLGKVCGGGFPLAAIAGRADIMAHFDRAKVGDEQFMTQVGTLSGNPVAATAGLATLKILREPDTHKRLFAVGQELMRQLAELLARTSLPAQVIGAPPVFDVIFSREAVRNYRDTIRGDSWLAKRFNALLRERGILKNENRHYLSTVHTPRDVQYTIDAWKSALDELVHDNEARASSS